MLGLPAVMMLALSASLFQSTCREVHLATASIQSPHNICIWLQIKLLRLLALLGAGDKAASDNMYAIIGETLRRANTGHTIGNAIIYECVRTITTIYPNPVLLHAGAQAAVPCPASHSKE